MCTGKTHRSLGTGGGGVRRVLHSPVVCVPLPLSFYPSFCASLLSFSDQLTLPSSHLHTLSICLTVYLLSMILAFYISDLMRSGIQVVLGGLGRLSTTQKCHSGFTCQDPSGSVPVSTVYKGPREGLQGSQARALHRFSNSCPGAVGPILGTHSPKLKQWGI